MPRAELLRVPVLLACLALGVLATACDDDDLAPAATPTANASTPAVSATPTPTPARTTTPTATASATTTARAVPAEVDAIINLVLAGDTEGLAQRVRLTALPCGPQAGGGSPPACPGGAANGTPVEVFPVATCEGELRPASAVRPTLDDVTRTSPKLFGVYRAPDPYLRAVKGEYVAVFSRQVSGQTWGSGLVIAGANVLGVWFGCGVPPSQIVPAGTTPVLLPGG